MSTETRSTEQTTLPAYDIITTQADLDLCLGSGELLPCPFCGHWAMSHGEKTTNGKAVRWTITCTHASGLWPDCCASVWATHSDQATARRQAVERWNRRAKPHPKLAEALNAIRMLMEELTCYTDTYGADEDDEQALALGRAVIVKANSKETP